MSREEPKSAMSVAATGQGVPSPHVLGSGQRSRGGQVEACQWCRSNGGLQRSSLVARWFSVSYASPVMPPCPPVVVLPAPSLKPSVRRHLFGASSDRFV